MRIFELILAAVFIAGLALNVWRVTNMLLAGSARYQSIQSSQTRTVTRVADPRRFWWSVAITCFGAAIYAISATLLLKGNL